MPLLKISKKLATRNPGTILTAIDIGASKIACFTGRVTQSGGVNIIGVGHHKSAGLKSGQLTDMEAASYAIRQALNTAEAMSQQRAENIIINVPAKYCHSHYLDTETFISRGEVNANDVRRGLQLVHALEQKHPEQVLIHTIINEFAVDDAGGIFDPYGMRGKTLKTRVHAITMDRTAMENFAVCVEQAGGKADMFALDIYATGIASLTNDEKELGTAVIDVGAGTTKTGVFSKGSLRSFSTLSLGGAHISSDLARGLSTSILSAERIKILYGSAMQGQGGNREKIEVPHIGTLEAESDIDPQISETSDVDEIKHQSRYDYVERSFVATIMQPRVEEIMEMVRARLEESQAQDLVGRSVVLTGGSSQINGLPKLSTMLLDKKIRIAEPRLDHISGLADTFQNPAFTQCIGLLLYAAFHVREMPGYTRPVLGSQKWYKKIWNWFKENW